MAPSGPLICHSGFGLRRLPWAWHACGRQPMGGFNQFDAWLGCTTLDGIYSPFGWYSLSWGLPLHIGVGTDAAACDPLVDVLGEEGQRHAAQLEHSIVEGAEV